MTLQVSKGYRVVPGSERWLPAPSRVLSCTTRFSNAVVNPWCYTPPTQGQVFLVSVKVWICVKAGVGNQEVQFRVRTGTERPGSVLDVEHWDLVLPCMFRDVELGWISHGCSFRYDWSMRMPYYGITRRFGLDVNADVVEDGQISASFQVEEIGV